MSVDLYYVARGDEPQRVCVGLAGAHAEVEALVEGRSIPPLEVFRSQWSEAWFAEAFNVTITPTDEVDLLEKLEEVSQWYKSASKDAKQYKIERDQLIIMAVFEGSQFEAVVEASGRSPYDIQKLINDPALTKAVVGDQELSAETIGDIELSMQRKVADDTKKRIRTKGAKNGDERAWLEKLEELKECDRQRRVSKKEQKDEWAGTDLTEDEYDKLKGLVDHWFG